MTDIRPARFPEDLDTVVRIFREYVASPTVSLDFQDFETEFAALPGKYAAPEGCVLLAELGLDPDAALAALPTHEGLQARLAAHRTGMAARAGA